MSAKKDAPQAPAQEPQEPQEGQEMAEGQHNSFVHALLTQAKALIEEKEGVYKRIDANRTTLRNIRDTGLLSDDQSKAIAAFYPTRQVKEKAEAETAQAA